MHCNTKQVSLRYLIVLILLVLLLAACAPHTATTGMQQGNFSNAPQGIGGTPEPGTNGKPQPALTGHWESLLASDGILYAGSDNGQLYAFDGNTGQVHWHFRAGTPPTLVGVLRGVLYATGGQILYAFDAQSGALRWRYTAPRDIDVTLSDNTLVLDTSTEGNISYLYTVSANSGKLLWQISFSDVTPGLLFVNDGTVAYIQIQGNIVRPTQTFFLLNASTGHTLWKYDLSSSDSMAHGAAEANGVVYVATTSGAIYAFNAASGTLLWHVAGPAPSFGPAVNVYPMVVNNIVYLATQHGLYAYRASNGALLWQRTTGMNFEPIVQQPIISNGSLYIPGMGGSVLALRTADGTQLWQRSGLYENGPMMLVNGLLQASSVNGAFALRAGSGRLLWRRSIGNHASLSSAGPPEIVADNHVYVQTDDGHIYTLDARSGKTLWSYAIQELPVQSSPVYSAFVYFKKGISYQQALSVVTSLGLKDFADCTFSWKSGRIEQDYQDGYMTVMATVSSAPLWFDRLKANPMVAAINPDGPHSCPNIPVDNNPRYLELSQAGTYLDVTFNPSVSSYSVALALMDNLGFRLADPCYEQARAQGKKPIWHDMSQQNTFERSHALVLATTTANPVTWQKLLRATNGVATVTTPFNATCQ